VKHKYFLKLKHFIRKQGSQVLDHVKNNYLFFSYYFFWIICRLHDSKIGTKKK